MKARKILIAEDDRNIRNGLIDALESEGHEVTASTNGEEAWQAFRENKFHLVILDIMMPGLSGYEVCKRIRKENELLPVLFLSAKGEEIDKVLGLELGADDYITKPFGVRELLARVSAALRRTSALANNGEQKESLPPESFPFGNCQVNGASLELTCNGQTTALTPREYKLLRLFYEHPNEALSRDFVLNEVWGIDYLGTTRTLDQHIAQIRKKIEPDPANPKHLQTVHGHGYRYRV